MSFTNSSSNLPATLATPGMMMDWMVPRITALITKAVMIPRGVVSYRLK